MEEDKKVEDEVIGLKIEGGPITERFEIEAKE